MTKTKTKSQVAVYNRSTKFQKGLNGLKQEKGMGTICYSQIHCNNALRKGRAITFNSDEIKIVRTGAKTLSEEFSHWVISFYDRTTSLMYNVNVISSGIFISELDQTRYCLRTM